MIDQNDYVEQYQCYVDSTNLDTGVWISSTFKDMLDLLCENKEYQRAVNVCLQSAFRDDYYLNITKSHLLASAGNPNPVKWSDEKIAELDNVLNQIFSRD